MVDGVETTRHNIQVLPFFCTFEGKTRGFWFGHGKTTRGYGTGDYFLTLIFLTLIFLTLIVLTLIILTPKIVT